MNLEPLYRKDFRLILICAVVSVVSLYVGVKYFFQAFPESSIDFRTTRESSEPVAKEFLTRMGLDPAGYRHAAIFDFDNDAKIFLERELGVEDSTKLLDTAIRLWRWEHRWFRPLQKEELQVAITPKGEPVGFAHLLDENAPGADLTSGQARLAAEKFLTETMGRSLDGLTFVDGSAKKRPNRTDHTFTWKLRDLDIEGADYRIEVGISGVRISGYQEFLNPPDAWERSYKNLRAWNRAASEVDIVFLVLTFVAMLIVLVIKIRVGDVRWGAAGILGTITFVLQTLSTLNTLPTDLYSYDTTVSFPSFLLQKILLSILTGLSFGAFIFLIAAAAEPLYRGRFPKFLSLTGLLRPRALRTKEFFVSSMVGITLTFFFFAYENVFYIVANSLGAWAPREVAYSDLLSTAFPWVYVLFFGWLPSISEEFISRMFSIPFFENIFRSRALAVVVAAFIWGFGHADYPNQPFYIRGLEVGIAGIVFGLVMLRYGIMAVVICHFSVDALYTAFVLFRSHNLYYVVTGGLSAGIFVILFIAAAVAYLLKGGFEKPELTNADDRYAPSPAPPAAALRAAEQGETRAAPRAARPGAPPPLVGETAWSGEAHSVGAGLAAAGEGGEAVEVRAGATERFPAYRTMDRRTILAGLGIAATLVVLSFVPLPHYGTWTDFKTTRDQARQSAETFLRGCGFDVSSYRSVVVTLDRTDNVAAAYLLEKGGLETANTTYRDLVPTPLWRARFYVPEQQEEFTVSVDPRTGAAVGFERKLPDDAAGASLSRAEALSLAGAFVQARGQDPTAGELKEQTEKDEKARRDHTLVWEYPIRGGADARVRYEVVVQGSAVGSWTRGVKVPEDWERWRTGRTALFTFLAVLKIPFFGLLAALAIVMLVVRIRAGDIPWKFGAVVGGMGAVVIAVTTLMGLDALWMRYDTAIPVPLFLVGLGVSLVLIPTFFFLLEWVIGSLTGSLYPQTESMLTRAGRRLYARDALIAGLISFGFARGLPALTHVLMWLIPSGRLIEGVPMPSSLDAVVPSLGVLAQSTFRVIFYPALFAILVAVLKRYFQATIPRALLAIFFILAFLPGEARRPDELVSAALSSVIAAGGLAVLIQFFLRDNPLAWVWSAWFALGIVAALDLLEQSARFYRASGAIALACILLPGIWLLKDAMAGTRREARGTLSATA